MAKSKLPKSIRKYIRSEKARIRREHFLNKQKQKEEIEKIYQKLKISYTKDNKNKSAVEKL